MAPVDLNEATKNWLKAVLALKHLKNGILPFVDSQISTYHNSLTSTHGVCILCAIENVLPCPTRNACLRRGRICHFHDSPHNQQRPCPSGVCENIRDDIVREHFKGEPLWRNTDATKWSNNAWEVAKCFLPPGSKDASSSVDTDCTGIISLCLHCKSITDLIDHHGIKSIFEKNRDNRNALMHSGSQELTVADRSSFIQDAVQLLSTFQTPVDRKTQDCIDTLNEIDSDGWLLTTDDIVDVMKDKVEAVRLKQEDLEASHKKTNETVAENTDELETYKKRIKEINVDLREAYSIIIKLKDIDVKNLGNDMETIRKKNEDMSIQIIRRIDELEATVKERHEDHDKRLEGHDQQHTQHDQKLDILYQQHKQHDKRLEGHDQQHQQHDRRLEGHEQQHKQHDYRLEGHDQQYKQHDQRLERHDQQYKHHDARLEGYDQRLGGHDKQHTQHDQRLERHDQQHKQHDQRLEEHDQQHKQHDQRLEGHDQQHKQHDQRLEEHDQQHKQHHQRLEGHDQRLKEHDQQNKQHDKRLEGHDKRLEGHDKRLEGHDQQHKQHDQRLDGHAQQHKEHDKRLEERLLEMETKVDDTIKKKTDAISAGRAHQPGINDVQNFLLAKYKRDSFDVPMSPILGTHCAHVDEIYTELIVRDDLVHKPKGKAKTRTLETLDQYVYVKRGRNRDTTKSYQDVLYDGKTACRNIYVVGNAGIGKTTWSRKFVATWVKAIEHKTPRGRRLPMFLFRKWRKLLEPNKNENSDDKVISDGNEKVLSKYDLVLYIELRHATADRHIMEMIEHQLFPDRPDLLETMRTLLNNPDSSSRCIIILDGLDEWCSAENTLLKDGTPVRDPTWKCSTITTSRAWKLEALQLGTNKIDRAVEIQGLDTAGANKLIDHVVAALNKTTAKSKDTSDFRLQIGQSVKACLQIPLLLTILICLWHDGMQLNTHLAETYSEMTEMLIRCAEGDKRKRLFEKLSADKLDEMKRNWATEKRLPPDCLSDKQLFVQYLPFLLRVGKLAFNALFLKRGESTLVFDHATIKTFLSNDELELSVKIGILSQATHPGSVLRQEFSVSFLHKTVQEYLATLYMVSGDSQSECVDKYKTYCKTCWDILEMENVLLFMNGMGPKTAREISCYIAEMEPNKDIHQMLLRCWRDSHSSVPNSSIYIKHHFLSSPSPLFSRRPSEYEDMLCYLHEEKDKYTTLYIDSYTYSYATVAGRTLLDLSECQSLRKLHCADSEVPLLVPDSLEEVTFNGYTGPTERVLDLSGCQSLRKLKYEKSNVRVLVPDSLEEVNIYMYTGSTEWVLDMSRCQSLKKLSYRDSDVRILVPDCLVEGEIVGYTGPTDWVLDLSMCQSLRKLEYSDSDIRILVPDSLEEVDIVGYTGSTEWMLDMSRCQSLRKLRYIYSNVRILVPDCLVEVEIDEYTSPTERVLDLSMCQSLRKLEYRVSDIRILVPDSLDEVDIVGYTGSTEWMLDMSRCQSLRKLRYIDSNVRILVPDCLVEVEIDGYTRPTERVLDLSMCQSLRKLEYRDSNVRILVPDSLEEVEIVEYTGPTERVLDMSRCQSLRTIDYKYSNVRIQVPDSLEEVTIVGYTRLTERVLDLSRCQSLRKLYYKYSNVKILVPDNLEELYIEQYTGPIKWVLDLSGCQSLKSVVYKKSNVRIHVPDGLEKV